MSLVGLTQIPHFTQLTQPHFTESVTYQPLFTYVFGIYVFGIADRQINLVFGLPKSLFYPNYQLLFIPIDLYQSSMIFGMYPSFHLSLSSGQIAATLQQ